jgi:hypothetical protein
MKTLLFVLAIVLVSCSKNFTPEQTAELQQTVTSQEFVFNAQSVTPATGRSIQLSPYHDLQVSKDSVIAGLPYYGRATAPINPNETGGINFISTDFEYAATENDKGWDIFIKPRDATDIQQLSIFISREGYATVKVSSLNRQPISFYGTVTKRMVRRS